MEDQSCDCEQLPCKHTKGLNGLYNRLIGEMLNIVDVAVPPTKESWGSVSSTGYISSSTPDQNEAIKRLVRSAFKREFERTENE